MQNNETKNKGKVLLYYNPHAGNGMFTSNLDKIIEQFQQKGFFVMPVRASKGVVDINQVIRSLDDSFVKIVAAGGDGTINIVVNAMINNDCHLPLAVFPAGTANDFAYYFNISTDMDKMIEIALDDYLVPADVGRCNDRYFVNVAAIGSVIDVSQKTDATMKNALGVIAYYLRALTELPQLHPVEVTVTTPDTTICDEIYFMVALNGNSAGGFRKLGVETSINDGMLDVIMFRNMKFFDVPKLALKVFQGKHNEDENVIYLKTPWLTIESKEPISTDIDGELGEPLPLKIQLLEKRIQVHANRPKE